jgi:hypothetical protein
MNVKSTLQRLVGMKSAITTTAQDLRQGLDTARAELAAKRAELDRVQRLPGPPAEVIAGLERAVDEYREHHAKEYGPQLLMRSAGLLVPAHLAGRDTAVPSRRPELPFEPSRPLTYGEQLFLHPEQEKAALRAMVLAQDYEAGPTAESRGPLLERLSREVAELDQAEEELVDELATAGVAVPHRAEVQARRDRAARAAELAEQRRKDKEWIEEQKRLGHLGTPVVHHGTMYPGRPRGQA